MRYEDFSDVRMYQQGYGSKDESVAVYATDLRGNAWVGRVKSDPLLYLVLAPMGVGDRYRYVIERDLVEWLERPAPVAPKARGIRLRWHKEWHAGRRAAVLARWAR